MRSQTSPSLLGFLTVEKTEVDDGFIGAMMVTETHGFPLEFRATTPVKPTAVQRVLYGASLEEFVSIELVGRRLLKDCQRKPPIVLVPKATLLGLTDSSVLVIAVRRAGEAIQVESSESSANTLGTGGRMSSATFQPIVYDSDANDSDVQLVIP